MSKEKRSDGYVNVRFLLRADLHKKVIKRQAEIMYETGRKPSIEEVMV